MLFKTKGIILHTIKYGDKKVICKIYTRDFGLQSYMVNVGSSARSKIKPALLLPLNQLELEVFSKQNKDLGRINEARCFYQYSDLSLNMAKNTISVFINEILYRSLHEEESNYELFDFIVHSFQWLDMSTLPVFNFHLFFLAALCKHLGFYPHNNYSSTENVFDLQEGVFIPGIPAHPHYLDKQESKDFSELFSLGLNDLTTYSIHKQQRNTLLNTLIRYYRLHVPGLKEIKSLAVLQATFN